MNEGSLLGDKRASLIMFRAANRSRKIGNEPSSGTCSKTARARSLRSNAMKLA
jgi:hypothetical protein